jgi:hydroxyacylglutathione hydrolase
MDIRALPAFKDNYIWTLSLNDAALVVDPGDAAPVKAYLKKNAKRLVAILVTHHHWDHSGGVKELADTHGCPVFGPAHEKIAGVTQPLGEHDRAPLPELGLTLHVMDIPGHTRGHIAFHGEGLLFCGDTLFSAGCGRLFEGTAEQMYHSLGKLAALAGEIEIYCGHEYTLANLKFAAAVEPDNHYIEKRTRHCEELRAKGLPTLPSTLMDEKRTNPFLRTAEPGVIVAASRYAGKKLEHAADVFAALRSWKDGF